MAYQSIQIEKLTPHIGGEIHGVDLSQPLDERTFKEIHDALIEHQVIFFRDQILTPEQHKAFGRLFGELHVHPAAPSLLEGHPEILVIHADEREDGELAFDAASNLVRRGEITNVILGSVNERHRTLDVA